MNKQEITEIVANSIKQELMINIDNIKMDTKLESLEIDSLDILKLAVSLEKTFDIKITTEELAKVETFGDIVTGIESKIS